MFMQSITKTLGTSTGNVFIPEQVSQKRKEEAKPVTIIARDTTPFLFAKQYMFKWEGDSNHPTYGFTETFLKLVEPLNNLHKKKSQRICRNLVEAYANSLSHSVKLKQERNTFLPIELKKHFAMTHLARTVVFTQAALAMYGAHKIQPIHKVIYDITPVIRQGLDDVLLAYRAEKQPKSTKRFVPALFTIKHG